MTENGSCELLHFQATKKHMHERRNIDFVRILPASPRESTGGLFAHFVFKHSGFPLSDSSVVLHRGENFVALVILFCAFPHLFAASISICLFIPSLFALPSSSIHYDTSDSWLHSCSHAVQNADRLVDHPYGPRLCVRHCSDIERMTNCFSLYVTAFWTGVFWRIAL